MGDTKTSEAILVYTSTIYIMLTYTSTQEPLYMIYQGEIKT